MQRNNRKRVFSDLLSIDAWHEPFSLEKESFGVHVELSFTEGRLGGVDADFPFTFKASLRRALLTISLETPLRIDRDTVARSIPHKQIDHTQILRAKTQARSIVGANASISPATLSAALSGDISRSKEVSREEELRIVQTFPETLVTARPEGSSSYSWELEPLLQPTLRGQPWDPVEHARMRVILPNGSDYDRSIKVEVTCAREDIKISELTPKDESLIEKMGCRLRGDLNDVTAIQYIRKILTDAELRPGELDNRFSNVIIADILALSK